MRAPEWEDWERRLLRRLYRDDKTQLRARLPHRTRSAIKKRAQLMGCCAPIEQRWVPFEDDVIATYRVTSLIAKRLPHRTVVAIQNRKNALGITQTVAWTPTRKTELREAFKAGFSDDEIARTLGRTTASISKKRHKLGMRRSAKLGASDNALCEDIRRQASKQMTLLELGNRVGEARAFHRKSPGKDSYRLYFRAVELLGGELYVEWLEP